MQTSEMPHPTWFEFVTLVAILVGPILALFAQRVLDKLREKRRAKENLYFAIMRHRAQWYHPERIQALNSIEVVFADNNNVLAKWKAFVDQSGTAKPRDSAGMATWNENLETTLCDLYQAIGKSLGYDFDLRQIRQGAYIPQLHADLDQAQVLAWMGLASALSSGELKVRVNDEMSVTETRNTAANAATASSTIPPNAS
jgi:hypothetical protein